MVKPLQKIIKEYPKRGPIQQFRLESALAVHCFRCGCGKVSKLLAIYSNDWNKILCNGCYGYLLSIYNIKAGTDSSDIKTEKLSNILLSLISEDQARLYAEKIRISEHKIKFLSKKTIHFLGTSEYVASKLENAVDLDWSPALIGLCKAFEIELINRFIMPLSHITKNLDLSNDIQDKDLGRVAKYCAGRTSLPPEIGVIGYFLQTAANSEKRINSSMLLEALKKLLAKWPKSIWFLDYRCAVDAINTLTMQYRNKAAHLGDVSRQEYSSCLDFITGEKGILWYLIAATEPESLVI